MNSLFLINRLNTGKRRFISDAATKKVRVELLVCLPVSWFVSWFMPIIPGLHEVLPDFSLAQKIIFGAARISNLSRIVLAILLFGYGTLDGFGQSPQIFNTSGTFTVPAGVTQVTVQAWGGGGGGSSITISNKEGGGGGGGAYASGSVLVIPGNTYNMVVGAGGPPNSIGSNSAFNTTSIVAAGGAGVPAGTATGGSGGTIAGSTGTIIYAGGKGGDATGGNSGGGGGGAGTTGDGGNAVGQTAGTGTSLDGGDGGSGVNGSANGIAGINFGGGGSGACKTTGTDRTGGAGADGQVKISWVCTTYNINSVSATRVCTGDQSIVTLTASSVNDLPIGGYVVSYNLGVPNAGSYSGVLTVLTAGTGTFTTSNLSNPGNTSINITNLASGSGTQICSNAISSGNTTTIQVVGGTLSPTTQNVCQLNSNSSPITLVGTYGQIIRWEKSADGGANWTNINKIINPLFDDFDSYGTFLVRAVIETTDGSVVCNSRTTQVIVDRRGTVTGYGGSNAVICLGQTINNLNASPGAVTRWEYKYSATDPSDWSIIAWIPIAGTSQSIYSPIPLLAGYYKYHAIISNGSCVDVPTTNATWKILVNPTPTLSNATQAATICENNPATINLTGLVAGSTFSLTYTINGGTAISVSGLTADATGNSSFTTGNLIASNNGQNLRITRITITSSTPNCPNTFARDVTLNVNQKSTDPTSATASSTTICNGQSTSLSLVGGVGGTGTMIHWYTVSCVETPVGTGNSLSVSPTTTTTYYGRYEDGAPCSYNSACSTVTIAVNQKSADPTSATASSTTICNGGSTTLTLNGGGGGTGETIKWFTVSCGGTPVGTGNSFSVSPTTTTTYYGRYEDGAPCSYNSACSTVTTTVKTNVSITSVTAAANPICSTATTTLTANGVTGTNTVVTWWTGASGTGANLGTGLTLANKAPGTYFSRVTGDCGATVEASVTVASKIDVGITSATAAANPICSTATTTLTANGVTGSNAVVTWWTGAGGTGTNLGSGLTLANRAPGTYYARVTGDCGTAVEVPVTIVGDTEAPTFTLPAIFPAPSYLASFCPADIYRAEFNNVPPESPYDLTYLRPDYYLFGAWFNILDITDVADNCALRVPPFDPVLNPDPISWVIHFAITTPLTPDLTGSGQISLYGTDIHFPVGDNTITYTVTDKAGVPTVKSVTLTVIPRPIMTKNP